MGSSRTLFVSSTWIRPLLTSNSRLFVSSSHRRCLLLISRGAKGVRVGARRRRRGLRVSSVQELDGRGKEDGSGDGTIPGLSEETLRVMVDAEIRRRRSTSFWAALRGAVVVIVALAQVGVTAMAGLVCFRSRKGLSTSIYFSSMIIGILVLQVWIDGIFRKRERGHERIFWDEKLRRVLNEVGLMRSAIMEIFQEKRKLAPDSDADSSGLSTALSENTTKLLEKMDTVVATVQAQGPQEMEFKMRVEEIEKKFEEERSVERRKIELLETQLEETKEKLNSEEIAMNEQLKDLESARGTLIEEAEMLREVNEAREGAIEELTIDNENLRESLKREVSMRESLEEDCRIFKEQVRVIDSLKRSYADSQKVEGQQRDKIQSLRQELSERREVEMDLREEIEYHQEKILQYRNEITKLERELRELRESVPSSRFEQVDETPVLASSSTSVSTPKFPSLRTEPANLEVTDRRDERQGASVEVASSQTEAPFAFSREDFSSQKSSVRKVVVRRKSKSNENAFDGGNTPEMEDETEIRLAELRTKLEEAKCKEELGDVLFNRIVAELEDMLETKPNDSRVLRDLALALISWAKSDLEDSEAQRRLERADVILSDLLELEDKDEGILFNLGLCLGLRAVFAEGEESENLFDASCAKYERLLQLNPNSRVGWFNLGLTLFSKAGVVREGMSRDSSAQTEAIRLFTEALSKFERCQELAVAGFDRKAEDYSKQCRQALSELGYSM